MGGMDRRTDGMDGQAGEMGRRRTYIFSYPVAVQHPRVFHTKVKFVSRSAVEVINLKAQEKAYKIKYAKLKRDGENEFGHAFIDYPQQLEGFG